MEEEMPPRSYALRRLAFLLVLSAYAIVPARAEDIAISNFGVAANGMPYAVALDKGFFTAEGANVTGIISSQGGGTSIRNMLAGGVVYGEANPGVTAVAIGQGADLKIISDNVLTVAEFVWAVKPDAPIKSIKDFKGRKIGYTNPRSTSQALAILLLQAAGYKPAEAELVKTGGFGEGVAALDIGAIDVAPMAEPVWSKFKGRYRAVAVASDILPPLDNVVGVTTRAGAETRGDFLRAIIRARRRAVEFMATSTEEAGDIVARHYSLDSDVARSAVRNLIASRTQNVPYWGSGQFHLDGMTRMIEVQKMVGAITGEIDLSGMIDTRFLPDDIKKPK
jgi:NitT/TauT family transport system substrate-binding protein